MSLTAKQIQRIAALAGEDGVDPRTVLRYILGERLQPEKVRHIEQAMRQLGHDIHIRVRRCG